MITRIALLVIGLFFVPSRATEINRTWNLQCDTKKSETLAVGTNFSVSVISRCSNMLIDGCVMTYIFEASGNKEDYKRVDVNEAGSNGDRAKVSLQNGAMFHYEFRKLDGRNSIMFNLTVVSLNQPHAVNLKIQTKYDGCTDAFTFGTINFKGCQNDSTFEVGVSNSDIVRYQDFGNIICNNGTKGRAVFSNGSEAMQTQCNASAKWTDTDDISCLYPIIAKLEIDGDEYRRIVELTYNHSTPNREVSLNCNFSDVGNVINSTTFHVDNQEKRRSSLIINPELNEKNVSCFVENDYTRRFNDPHLSTSTLNITFGPYKPPDYSSLCSLSNGSIQFYSNPKSSTNGLKLVTQGNISQNLGVFDDEIPSNITDCCGTQYGVQGQMITPIEILTNRSNWYLRTNYSRNYEYYQVDSCENTATASTTTNGTPSKETTATTASFDKLTLIAAAVGGLTLILAVLAACLCWRRSHQGKLKTVQEDKVENINPLYGTAGNMDDGVEEVISPLYGLPQSAGGDDVTKTNSEPGEINNDVYAVVQKEKGKHKGQENSGFIGTEENEATYSVVDKTKQKKGQDKPSSNEPEQGDATYSVVNKKEKAKGAQNSSQPNVTETEMYAAVDRTKKKEREDKKEPQPENDPESATSTYAQVDRTAKKNKKKLP